MRTPDQTGTGAGGRNGPVRRGGTIAPAYNAESTRTPGPPGAWYASTRPGRGISDATYFNAGCGTHLASLYDAFVEDLTPAP